LRSRGSDYFENSRQATFVQQEYAVRNPRGYAGYGRALLGVHGLRRPRLVASAWATASSANSSTTSRGGAPFGPDDGTVAPWVAVASLPLRAGDRHPDDPPFFARMDLGMTAKYGFKPSFNPSFAVDDSPTGWWVTPYHFRDRSGAGGC